ncbi:MAG: phosphoserine phosphatase SerB [Rhizobiales bacterium]|nr:phosphoserine phosphatase SerB [Hyphomicrobiales bacterium]
MPATSHQPLVATLVAGGGNSSLDLGLIAKLRSALGGAEVSVLSPQRAVDLYPTQLSADTVKATIADTLAGTSVDVIVQPASARRKKLFLADMDSTMIGQECIDELADAAGLKAHVSAITERAMRGEIAFEPALRERVALLKGLPSGIVDRMIAERITLTPGGRALVRTMRQNGAYTALVSGGFTVFTGPIGEMIGFDMHRSNTLLMENGQFSGLVAEPILGREAKRATLVELRDAHRLGVQETLAVGDGANDLAMLGEAGLGVAFHAKPIVAEAAHARIDHTDLRTLLYAQGYRDEDITEA